MLRKRSVIVKMLNDLNSLLVTPLLIKRGKVPILKRDKKWENILKLIFGLTNVLTFFLVLSIVFLFLQ